MRRSKSTQEEYQDQHKKFASITSCSRSLSAPRGRALKSAVFPGLRDDAHNENTLAAGGTKYRDRKG